MRRGKKAVAFLSAVSLILATPIVSVHAANGERSLDKEALLQVGNGVILVENGELTGNTVDGAKYDLETNTLTLENCRMESDEENQKPAFVYATGMGEDFTIQLIGDNVIDGGTMSADDLTIKGPGTLTFSETITYGGILSYRDSLNIENCTINITGVPESDAGFYGISSSVRDDKATEAVIKNANVNISSTTPAGKEYYNVGIDAQTGNLTVINSNIDIQLINGRTFGMVAGLDRSGVIGGKMDISGSTVKVLIDSDITDPRYSPFGMYFYNMQNRDQNYYYVGEDTPNELKSFEDAFEYWDWSGRYNVSSSIIISDKELPEYCDHVWDAGKVTKEPSCESDGVKTYTCTRCKSTKTEKISALGHKWGEWEEIKKPSCTEKGVQTRVCERCNKNEDDKIPALGHDLVVTVIKEATCTEKGLQQEKCTRCDYTANEKEIPAKGHSYGQWTVTKEATFHEDGEEARTCSACHKTETRRIPKLSETHEHDYTGKVEIIKEATCIEEGKKRVYCTEPECGEFIEETIPLAAHTPGEWVTVKEASCSEEGLQQKVCTVCNAIIEEKKVEKLPHTYGEWTIAKEATCTELGVETAKCTVCGETGVRSIEPLGHDLTEWEVTKKATCTEDGKESAECIRCGEIVTRVIKATGHQWGEWEITTEPTATVQGEKKAVCQVCGEEKTEKIPSLNGSQPSYPGQAGKDNRYSNGAEEKAAKTGDSTSVMLWTILLAAAGVSAFEVSKKRKRK